MPADYLPADLAEMARDSQEPPITSASLAVQINSAFADLALVASRQADKWRVLVILRRAVESLREATPGAHRTTGGDR